VTVTNFFLNEASYEENPSAPPRISLIIILCTHCLIDYYDYARLRKTPWGKQWIVDPPSNSMTFKPRHSFKLKAYHKPTRRLDFVFHRLISFRVILLSFLHQGTVRLSQFLPVSLVSTYRSFPTKLLLNLGLRNQCKKTLDTIDNFFLQHRQTSIGLLFRKTGYILQPTLETDRPRHLTATYHRSITQTCSP
jgi:hypothetical protein